MDVSRSVSARCPFLCKPARSPAGAGFSGTRLPDLSRSALVPTAVQLTHSSFFARPRVSTSVSGGVVLATGSPMYSASVGKGLNHHTVVRAGCCCGRFHCPSVRCCAFVFPLSVIRETRTPQRAYTRAFQVSVGFQHQECRTNAEVALRVAPRGLDAGLLGMLGGEFAVSTPFHSFSPVARLGFSLGV